MRECWTIATVYHGRQLDVERLHSIAIEYLELGAKSHIENITTIDIIATIGNLAVCRRISLADRKAEHPLPWQHNNALTHTSAPQHTKCAMCLRWHALTRCLCHLEGDVL